MKALLPATLPLLLATPLAGGQDFFTDNEIFNDALLRLMAPPGTTSPDDAPFAGENFARRINCLVLQNRNGAECADIPGIYNQPQGSPRQVWVAPGYAVDHAGGFLHESMVLRGTVDYYRGAAYEFRRPWKPVAVGSGR